MKNPNPAPNSNLELNDMQLECVAAGKDGGSSGGIFGNFKLNGGFQGGRI